MAESQIHDEPYPEDSTPEEPDLQPQPEGEPVETRGIAWIIVPALLGLVIGVLIGMARAMLPGAGQSGLSPQQGLLTGAVSGAAVGLIAGGVLGLLIWVVFPYKGRNPHAPPPEPTNAEPPAPRDDYGV